MSSYADFYRQSIDQRDVFWAEQARLIDWQTPPQQVCDYSNPPFARWFVGGTTNLCHNAVDRHLKDRASQAALVAISTETDTERSYSFAELHAEVQRMAASLQALGVQEGRPGADLHAHDCRGRLCHAGLHAHWRNAFGGVWRFCLGFAGVAHRRCRT